MSRDDFAYFHVPRELPPPRSFPDVLDCCALAVLDSVDVAGLADVRAAIVRAALQAGQVVPAELAADLCRRFADADPDSLAWMIAGELEAQGCFEHGNGYVDSLDYDSRIHEAWSLDDLGAVLLDRVYRLSDLPPGAPADWCRRVAAWLLTQRSAKQRAAGGAAVARLERIAAGAEVYSPPSRAARAAGAAARRMIQGVTNG